MISKNLATETEAKRILEPHLAKISRIYVESLEDLNKVLNATNQEINKRNKSGLLHNFAINRAKQYFEEDSNDITIIEKYSSILVMFKSEKSLVGRFKKVDKKNLSSGISTKRRNIIVNQLSLFPEYDVTYIEFGYRINSTYTEFDTVVVLCRIGNDVVWNFELNVNVEDFAIREETVTTSFEIEDTEEEKQIKLKNKHIRHKTNEEGQP